MRLEVLFARSLIGLLTALASVAAGGQAPSALEEIVVTARRREERLLDVPFRVE